MLKYLLIFADTNFYYKLINKAGHTKKLKIIHFGLIFNENTLVLKIFNHWYEIFNRFLKFNLISFYFYFSFFPTPFQKSTLLEGVLRRLNIN